MAEERKAKGTDAPTCKICGARHWFRDPHQFGKVPAKAAALAVAKKAVEAPPAAKAKKRAAGKNGRPRGKRKAAAK